jgi:DnaJ-class molecular chaperone
MPILIIDGEKRIECPCCKGRGYLVVYEQTSEGLRAVGFGEYCTHCMGDGTIPTNE